ncbi:MAG: glycosyltransferase [Hyphomicrobiales bacterium]|nr:glycosyltransferase [Hyphomicrobiales bacterium]
MRLIGVHRLHHRKGGAEGVHLDHLTLFKDRGWTCAEFAMDHPDNEPSPWSRYFPERFDPPTGLLGVSALPRFFHSSEAQEKFARLISDFKPDVIHAHGIYHHLTNAILKPALAAGVPIVYTLHDYKLLCPAYHLYTEKAGVCERCKGGRQWRCLTNRCTHGSLAMDAVYALDGYMQWRSGMLRNAVSRFVGPCRFIVEKFAEFGFDTSKLRYVPNFFESADDAPTDPAVVARLRQEIGPHFLYFGRLSPEKGLDVLIDAAALAGASLVIVGDGPERNKLESLTKARGVSCTFKGHLKGVALWAQVEAADAVVLPSVWYEIAPKSILEAQARGKAVLTTRIGGLPELVTDGVTGLIAAPGDRLSLAECIRRFVAMSAPERAALGVRARTHVRTAFTRDRYYREMTAIYQELLGGRVAA